MPEYFLGVDGGQSSTTALIGDGAGQPLGRGTAGPCNHVGAAEGREKFSNALTGCVHAAIAEAGLPADIVFQAACLGFSGGPADKEALVHELVRSRRLLVTHDAFIALSGATAGEPGVIVIAGTGSMAFGRNPSGVTARAGGWGYLFGDEGGAFDIVRQALRAALRDEEGWGPPTALRSSLVAACGVRNANDLMHRFYTAEFPRHRIASLAGVVATAATEGDAAALDVLHSAGEQLANLAVAVHHQLFAPEEAATASYVGGVFQNPCVRERFFAALGERPGIRCAPALFGPAEGALFEAYRLTGKNPRPSALTGN